MMTDVQTHNTADVMPATPQGRRLSVALLLIAAGLAIFFFWFAQPVLQSAFRPNPSPSSLSLLKTILLGCTAIVIVCGATLIWSGRNIIRANQCPPPGAWVWRNTKIRRGRAAVHIGWTYILCGILACLVCMTLTAYVFKTLERASQRPQLPPGITILQERHFTVK